jgi:hypothetical protein
MFQARCVNTPRLHMHDMNVMQHNACAVVVPVVCSTARVRILDVRHPVGQSEFPQELDSQQSTGRHSATVLCVEGQAGFPKATPHPPMSAGTPTTRHICCTAGLHPQHNICCAPTPAPGDQSEDAPPELWGPTLHVTHNSTTLHTPKECIRQVNSPGFKGDHIQLVGLHACHLAA